MILAGLIYWGLGWTKAAFGQTASIVATAVFFGTAVAVSFLLWDVL